MKFVISENMTSQPAASFYTKHLCPVLLYFLFLFQDKALPAKKRAVSQPAVFQQGQSVPATTILLHRIRP